MKNMPTDLILKKANGSDKRVILPESFDERILQAVKMAVSTDICKIVLLGKKENYTHVFDKAILDRLLFLDYSDKKLFDRYVDKLVELRASKGMTKGKAEMLLKDNIYFATMAVKMGDADGLVAGAVTSTADVLRPAFQIIKTKTEGDIASSCMIFELPENCKYGTNGAIVFGDCAVIENPTAMQLMSITFQTAETARTLLGFKPCVAMLSYSTHSAGNVSADVQKVKDAFGLVRKNKPSFVVDGELQVDAAIDCEVARLKSKNSPVKGKANVLIFPDLNSGNIGYKLLQRFAGAKAVGPIIQGLALPVNDVSRGADAEEIFLTIAVTAVQAKGV